MSICSLYKIAYKMPDDSHLVLCDIGDQLDAEPSYPGMQKLDPYEPIRAKYAGVWPRGVVDRAVYVSRVYEFATPNAARVFELEQMELLDGMVKSELYYEIKDGKTFTLNKAMLVGEPRPKDTDVYPPNVVVMDYIIFGGEFVEQAPTNLNLYQRSGGGYYVRSSN